MSRRRRYVRRLSEAEVRELKKGERKARTLGERNRIRIVLLSAQGLAIKDIAGLLSVSVHTVIRALNRFERDGIVGLKEGRHTGRPPKIPP